MIPRFEVRDLCLSRSLIVLSQEITNANGDVRLKGRFDCTAAGVVYVITCQRCHKLYIGETGRRLLDCFGEHFHSLQGFKQNPRYQGGGFPVAEHFNLPDHKQVHDMRVSVVRQVKGGAPTRQREERRLIFKLGTLAPGGFQISLIRLQNRNNVRAQYLSGASTPYHARTLTVFLVNFNVCFLSTDEGVIPEKSRFLLL